MIKTNYTFEDNKLILENHGRRTLPQIMKMLNKSNLTYTAFRSKCQRMGLFRDKHCVRIPHKEYNFHNQDYWKHPTLENCYFSGLIAADGCIFVDKKSNGFNFSYKLAKKDEILLDNLSKALDFNGRKIISFNKSPHSNNISELREIRINCFDQNAKYLKEHFNIEPCKTFRLGPINLKEKDFILAFIIGFIDGDGSIETNKTHLAISFNSSADKLINWIKEKMDEYFPWSLRGFSNIRKQERDNCYQFYIHGTRAAIIFDTLSKFNVPKLARKWENPKALAYLEQQKLKYPELFVPKLISSPVQSALLNENALLV